MGPSLHITRVRIGVTAFYYAEVMEGVLIWINAYGLDGVLLSRWFLQWCLQNKHVLYGPGLAEIDE